MKKILLTFGCGLFMAGASAQMVINGELYIAEGATVAIGMSAINSGDLTNYGNLELRGDLINNSNFDSKGILSLKSEKPLIISGDRAVNADIINLESDVELSTPIHISKMLEFGGGFVFTNNQASVIFGPNAGHHASSNFSHIVGNVEKSGFGSFSFPLGDGLTYRPFSVNELGGQNYRAYYVSESPMFVSSEIDYDVEGVNNMEYWMIQSKDASKVGVSLSNNDVVYLKEGVWSNSDRGILVSNNGTAFTSGNAKHIIKEIGVWPNPTSGVFNLKLTGMRDTDDIVVDITNQDGRIIRTMSGKVSELRKAYTLPSNLVTTNLKVRVINGDEVLTQSLILNK